MLTKQTSEYHSLKTPDATERYLIEVMNEYFKQHPNRSLDKYTKESLINEALFRLKKEFHFDATGVTSVNGQQGVITITADSLGAEPRIEEKHSAFNKDFGTTAGTVCAGDDPRLSDARIPKPHQHDISQILGLRSKLNEISSILQNSNEHAHENYELLNRLNDSSGKEGIIDLSLLQSYEEMIARTKQEMEAYVAEKIEEMNAIKSELETLISEYNQGGSVVQDQINAAKNSILQNFQDSVNASVEQINERIESVKRTLPTPERLEEFRNMAENSFQYINSKIVKLQDLPFSYNSIPIDCSDLLGDINQYHVYRIEAYLCSTPEGEEVVALPYLKNGFSISYAYSNTSPNAVLYVRGADSYEQFPEDFCLNYVFLHVFGKEVS